MRAVRLLVAGAVCGAALLLAPGTAHADVSFSLTLSGAAEVPAGDPDGSGTATLTFRDATQDVCLNATVQNIDTVQAGHIHVGAAGSAGGVVVNFSLVQADFVNGTVAKCVAVSATVRGQVEANPAGYYLNIHTTAFAPGAIRGQLASGPAPVVPESPYLWLLSASALALLGGAYALNRRQALSA